MSWNYRLVRTYPPGEDEPMVAIHEVYYDKAGKPDGYTAEPVYPYAATWQEFSKVFALYQRAAICKPSEILDERKHFATKERES